LQEKSQTFSDFVRRTDALADQVGLNLSESWRLLGISRAMLHAYRSGKNRITPKVWLKLERAERDAGISYDDSLPKSDFEYKSANPKQVDLVNPPHLLCEDPLEYRVKSTTLADPELLAILERIATALEEIAKQWHQ
jgi:hypothetical protein